MPGGERGRGGGVTDSWDGVARRRRPTARDAAGLRADAPAARGADDGRRRPRRQRLPRPLARPRRRRGRRRRGAAAGAPAPARRASSPARSTCTPSSRRALADYLGQPAALVFSTGYHANLARRHGAQRRATRWSSPTRTSMPRSSTPAAARGRGRLVVAAQRRRPPSTARCRAANGVRWCSPSRSTRCSATPPRSPTSPLCGRADAVLSSTRRTRSASQVGPGLVAASGLTGIGRHGRHDAHALQGARQPGRRRARPPTVVDAPGQRGPTVHLRHRARTGGGGRRACGRSRSCAPRPRWPPSSARDRATSPPRSASCPARAPCCRCRCRRRTPRWPPRPTALAQAVRVGCFRPPSVPDGVSRLRLTVNAGLPDDAWTGAVEIVVAVVKEHGA